MPKIRHPFCTVFVAAALAVGAVASHAERADRSKPLNVEADQQSKLDMLNQVVVFNGNVVATKGTMTMRSERIEVRETPEGYHLASAIGSASRPATFRQKRDGVNEFIEGQADRLEYDGRADVIRFVGNAQVRRLRGTAVADEVSGALITWDNTAEQFNVSAGNSAQSAANPGGRVRAVLTPRETPAAGASSPAAASAPPLQRIERLEDPK